MLQFIKKHYKGLLIGLGVIVSFIGGIFAGIARRSNISSAGPNSKESSGHEAAAQIDSQRLAENSGKASGQLEGIADDNRRASAENQIIGDDNKRLSDLASKLDKLASTGGN